MDDTSYLPYSQIRGLLKTRKGIPEFFVTKEKDVYVFFKKLPLTQKSKKTLVEFSHKRSGIKKRKIVKKKLPKKTKKLSIFLDIDSTITKDNSEEPDARCRKVFEKNETIRS